MTLLPTLVLAAMTASPAGAAEATLETDIQKTFYALGANVGADLASGFSLSKDELRIVTMGLQDGALGRKLKVDTTDYDKKIGELQTERREATNKAYLDKAAKEEGVKSFPSGLLFKELKPGEGAKPEATDTVKVHYHGTFTNGKVFDSSVDRGQPATFPLNRVIPCWTEGVAKMAVGAKARLVCPHDIAYGERGRPPVIPASAVLVFEVELLEIVSKQDRASDE
ncbi:MAG: FKBP-type peptidyl-prolyl cis-trans isomerase [Elusimicrobiota bacterium]